MLRAYLLRFPSYALVSYGKLNESSLAGRHTAIPPRSYSVILVDDDDFNLMVMGEIISSESSLLATAINGRVALEYVMSQRPDVIIMDLEMPIMGCIEVLQHIRQYQKQVMQPPSFIIDYSGNGDAHSCDIKACNERCVLDYAGSKSGE
jgi:CheY-like chemotaxis protein